MELHDIRKDWILPSERTRSACSLVWPPLSNPVSNSPVVASTTNIATSAWAVPKIIFGMKSRCPGASRRVTDLVSVSNCDWPTSMVIPRDLMAEVSGIDVETVIYSIEENTTRCYLSSPVSSRTQAYMKDCLPSFFDSCSYLCICLAGTWPRRYSKWPISVDLPASTWPTTTKFRSALDPDRSLAYSQTASGLFSLAFLPFPKEADFTLVDRRPTSLLFTPSLFYKRTIVNDISLTQMAV